MAAQPPSPMTYTQSRARDAPYRVKVYNDGVVDAMLQTHKHHQAEAAKKERLCERYILDRTRREAALQYEVQQTLAARAAHKEANYTALHSTVMDGHKFVAELDSNGLTALHLAKFLSIPHRLRT
eukprot:14403-Heterococcus_DN1.PRE.2